MTKLTVDDLEEGQTVIVTVNDRAAKHLGTHEFRATVSDLLAPSVRFEPETPLQQQCDGHTWYADIGYIHGHHDGVGGYTDIGRVRYVESVGETA